MAGTDNLPLLWLHRFETMQLTTTTKTRK